VALSIGAAALFATKSLGSLMLKPEKKEGYNG